MNKWSLLGTAIVAEVAGALMLRAAVEQPAWIPAVVIAYIAAFTLIGLTLRAGMPIGVAYGIWGAAGVALVAALGTTIFGEILSLGALIGIVVIIVGVVMVETGSHLPEDTVQKETESWHGFGFYFPSFSKSSAHFRFAQLMAFGNEFGLSR